MKSVLKRVFLWALLLILCLTAPGLTRAQTTVLVRDFTLGLSGMGRSIDVVQFGNGPRKLVVVGDTHGGPETNTYQLTLELIAHFRANPDLVPVGVRLYFIPSLNPDGLALGTRFDGSGIDLNRNMNTNLDACPENDWRVTVEGARGIISDTGGPYPDSQIESRLIRGFLLDASGAIFIHSNAGLVFPAYCEHQPSIALAETYAGAAGYQYSRFWPNYMITGSMSDWAGSLGIAAITPELVSGDQSEFTENLAGLQAVLGDAERLLPLPEDGAIDGIAIPGPLYRYWRSLGGMQRFGPPLAPAETSATGVQQTFRNIRLGLDPTLVDTAYYIQPVPLGTAAAEALAYGGSAARSPGDPASAPRFFPESGHTLKEAFLAYWDQGGGLEVFGLPLSEEFTSTTADGQQRIVQYFERAIFAYYPEDGSVRLEPLGVRAITLEHLARPTAPQTIR